MIMFCVSIAAKVYMKPHVKTVILELLNIIRETENDDLTGTMQRLVCHYVEEVMPIAVEMMSHLVSKHLMLLISISYLNRLISKGWNQRYLCAIQ